ncbi:MAG: PLDc N-terminal domain-containing protein [Desulfovibrionales bacterium]
MFGLSPAELAVVAGILLLPIVPSLWAIWHIFHCDFPTPQEKMAWLGASVFIPVLGGLTYIFWGRKRARKVL